MLATTLFVPFSAYSQDQASAPEEVAVPAKAKGNVAAKKKAIQPQTASPQTNQESAIQPQASRNPWAGKGTVNPSIGLRHDKLNFTISGPNNQPNILSELEWKTDMTEFRLNGGWLSNNGFTVIGELAYASGFAGEGQDSDYLYNDRQGEFSRSYSKTKGSTSNRASLGLGWRFSPHSSLGLTPLVGYTYQKDKLRSRHGKQVINFDPNTGAPGYIGPFDGLDSRYSPHWQGPWLGAQIDTRVGERFDFLFSAKHQWFDYRAEANWNLRSDFAHPKSFRHTGDSHGWKLEAGTAWRFFPRSALTFTLDWQSRRLSNGKYRVYFADGTSGETRLRSVTWESFSGVIGYRFTF
jgi:hypothetical protein